MTDPQPRDGLQLPDGEAAIRAALADGPTPGPWIDDRHERAVSPWTQVKAENHPGRGVVMDVRLSDIGSFNCTIGKSEQEWVNAAYIAACNPVAITALLSAKDAMAVELGSFKELDREAGNHVEAVICLHSRRFTGDPPYVGWEGLGLALRQDYAELAALRAQVVQKPLSEADVRAEADRRWAAGNELLTFKAGVRYAESAHNIKDQP